MTARCEAHDEDNKVESGPEHGRVGDLSAGLPSAPGDSCVRGMNEVNDGETAPKPPIGELMGTEQKREDNSWCLVRL